MSRLRPGRHQPRPRVSSRPGRSLAPHAPCGSLGTDARLQLGDPQHKSQSHLQNDSTPQPPFNLCRVRRCNVRQCPRRVCAHADPTQVVGSGTQAYVCVAMAPTTAVTAEPICCVAMAMVISPRVGELTEREGWDSKKKRKK